MTREQKFMQEAIALSQKGMDNNEGGPFGCIIVKGDEIVGRGNNKVSSSNDPTAHAEVTAIRDACKNLDTFQLSDCEVYTSCEPCPMCLGAIYWAGIRRLVYASDRYSAASAGFSDNHIYEELALDNGKRSIEMVRGLKEEGDTILKRWVELPDKIQY